MKVIYELGSFKKSIKNVVLVIGVFDGLHLGHQALIRRAVAKARAINGKVVAMTFSPHPVHVLHPEIKIPLIVSLSYRLKLLEEQGVDICFVVRFTKQFSCQTPEKFIKRYLIEHIQPKDVFVGDDFRFGQNRSGTLDYFSEAGRENGFSVHPIHPIRENKVSKISSTHIRQLISSGNLSQARKLLGRDVSIRGIVVRGDDRGKSLGYPTANMIPENEIIPPMGVYAVKVVLGKKIFYGVANVGQRPSFGKKDNRIIVEAYIFNFHRQIYGKVIIVEFIKKIRNERFFHSREKLVQQIQKDVIRARSILF